jgi:hypothetical protein
MTDPSLITDELSRFEGVASSFVFRDFNDNELCFYPLAAEAVFVFINRNSLPVSKFTQKQRRSNVSFIQK